MADTGFWEQALIYFMMGVMPWIFAGVGAWLLWGAHSFMKGATKTTGTVLSVRRSTSTSGSGADRRTSISYKPTFEYVDGAGRTQRAETFLSSSGYNYRIGEQREILVNPDTPEKVRMPGFMIYGFGAIFASIGVLFGILGIFAMLNM